MEFLRDYIMSNPQITEEGIGQTFELNSNNPVYSSEDKGYVPDLQEWFMGPYPHSFSKEVVPPNIGEIQHSTPFKYNEILGAQRAAAKKLQKMSKKDLAEYLIANDTFKTLSGDLQQDYSKELLRRLLAQDGDISKIKPINDGDIEALLRNRAGHNIVYDILNSSVEY